MTVEKQKAPDGFVRGGTPTSKSEQLYEQRFQEAEVRRDEADAERKNAVQVEAKKDMDKALATAAATGKGVEFNNQLTAHSDVPKAYVPLKYCNSRGEQVAISGEPVVCCADLIVGVDPSHPQELTIILVCPRCMQEGQKHEQDCQIQIRQSNRNFEFVPGNGEKFVFQGEMLNKAGTIVESEAFRCPDCNWRARIANNRVLPD